MRLFIAALLIIFLSTFSAVAEAQTAPDHLIITGKDWMVANGLDTSTIMVTVYDSAGNTIPAATVTFAVPSPWTLSTTTGVTDGLGRISTVLQATTKAGAATVTVNASVFDAGVLHATEGSYTQNIDHGTPQFAVPTYEINVSIGATTTILVKVTDAAGNPVDNRNVAEQVQFAASTSTDSAFWDGTTYVKTLTVPVDSGGVARATFLVARSGNNYVDIQPPSPVSHKLITIYGVNDGAPYSITQAVSPGGYPYPYAKTDGSKFRIIYTLLDQFGNPAGNRGVRVYSNVPGEDMILTTNSMGIIAFFYQKDSAGLYTLSATALDNTTVTTSQIVEFIAADPTTMLLTASPQTMPSRDVKESISSTLFAKVIDVKGNPVKDEPVTFTVWSYNIGTSNQTMEPVLENETFTTNVLRTQVLQTTDSDGLARVTFRPGAFTRDRNDPKYSYTSKGSAVVMATWRDVTHNIDLQYVNYPFLSVDAIAEPRTLEVNQSVNITIRLKGDGWALQPKPIDVVLVTDRSGSMLFNETLVTSTYPDTITSESPEDRMVMAMNAAKIFVDKMNSSDRIGLVSFGDCTSMGGWALLYNTGNPATAPYIYGYNWRAGRDYAINRYGNGYEYSTDDISYVTTRYPGHGTTGKYYGSAMATSDLSLAYDKSTVKNKVDQMVPAGGTPSRYGLYEGVKQFTTDPEIAAHKRDDAVRAIVLLTDGAWNTGGDPRGGSGAVSLPTIGTGSVITWAKNNHIRIYTIALGSEPYHDQLQAYADETGGKAYAASSGLDLAGIYTAIAGELHTQAGIGTTMDLAFHDVDVNGAMFPGLDVMEYKCMIPGGTSPCTPAGPGDFISTHEFSYNLSMPVIVNRFYDQTADWSDKNLHYNVGTIFIGGVWETNFSMKIKRDGNIKVLNSSSTIQFNDGSVLPLPDTYVTARPDNPGGQFGIGIWVTHVRRTDPGVNPDYADIEWNLTYTGLEPTIEEYVDIRQDGSTDWLPRLATTVDSSAVSDTMTLDTSGLASGIWYVRVTAMALDAGMDAGVTQIQIQKAEGTPKIKIL
ncbi:MAG TPA: Ig-like domain-containing protein [Methanomicrobiales archaeon]|nr:Ig-like domain-containing protein [Methanomicrobiales archaeon]